MKLRNGIMTVVLALGVLLTTGVAQATLYETPLGAWPNSVTDTRNPYTDSGTGGVWTAYSQARGQTNTGTYDLSTAGEPGGNLQWLPPAAPAWMSVTSAAASTDVVFRVCGTMYHPDQDGWAVLGFQPAVGGDDVSITGQLAVIWDAAKPNYFLSITAEIIKLNAAGDVAEVIGSTTGLTMAGGAWSFDLTTSMLATDTIRLRLIDMDSSTRASGLVQLSNYQIDVTPEPASLSLLAVGGLGILLRRKA